MFSMKAVTVTMLIALGLMLPSLAANGAEMPKELAAAVGVAEKDGRAVFEAVRQSGPPDGQAVSDARKQISNFCNFKYSPVLVSFRGKTAVYFLAQSSSPDEIVFGRHFKVLGPKVTASTNACSVSGSAPPNAVAVAAYVTHVLSTAPSEFHVYLSLKHSKAIFVRTSAGTWGVEKGKIRFLQDQRK
jgi:hypothetical protein